MKIAILDGGKPLPAKDYGGTERVLWALGYELHQMGHKIVYIVPEGSYCHFADVIVYDPSVSINDLIPDDVDIIHLTFNPGEQLKIPHIVTVHGNAKVSETLSFNTVFVSKNHAERHHSEIFVHNGLLWSDYPKPDLELTREYLHFLGKASWKVKNLPGACKIAIKSGHRLKVMGGSRWTLYNLKRKPLLTLNPKIEYCGMVNDQQKVTIMQKSIGLLFPVKWNEPFGLALIETLYAGCPVFGAKSGSLPELISQEVGFLSNNWADLVHAVKTLEFDPVICHNYALQHFNSRKMAQQYEDIYKKVLGGAVLNPSRPYAQ